MNVIYLPAGILAVVFGAAAYGKSRAFGDFRGYVAGLLGLTSHSAVARLLSVGVVAVEVALVMFLVVAPGFVSFAFCVGLVVAVTAVLGLAYNRPDVGGCACFGRRSTTHGGDITDRRDTRGLVLDYVRPLWHALRNTGLLALSMWGLSVSGPMPSPWPIVFLACPTVILIVGLTVSIVRERLHLRSVWHPRYGKYARIVAPLVVMDYYRQRPF